MRYIFSFLLLTLLLTNSFRLAGQSYFNVDDKGAQWVDSVYTSLTTDERIAQLFWIAIEPTNSVLQKKNLEWIKQDQPGGIIFFKTQSDKLIELSNYYQGLSKVPLTVAIDGEWGLAMRLKDATAFPYQMTLGALKNDSLIYEMGLQIGQQMKAMGIHVNLAPVVDVNNNADNPVIGKRSFGELPHNVASKSWAYAKGLQDADIIAVAKHFPGHGDTNKDSHHTLPLIAHGYLRLDSIELVPFKHVVDSGIMGIMTAHLSIPSLETESGRPSGLSKSIVNDLLKDSLKFNGLVVTDAMNMGGVSKFAKRGELELQALMAGNDIVEFTTDLPLAVAHIKKSIQSGRFTEHELEEKCKKVLSAKYWSGLDQYKAIDTTGIKRVISSPQVDCLNHSLYASALTLLKNTNDILPFKHLDKLNSVTICANNSKEYEDYLWRYKHSEVLKLGSSDFDKWSDSKTDDLVILFIEDYKQYQSNKYQIEELLKNRKCILVFMGNPYQLELIEGHERADALLLTYQNNSITRDLAIQALFGAIPLDGHLPVSINHNYPAGYGLRTESLNRLKYSLPEQLNLDSEYINNKVDSVATKGIEIGAFPGCRVLVAIEGEVIFNKSYGHHTYKKEKEVKQHDVFDLASVTKITGPLPLIMKGVEQGLIDLDAPFSEYWPDWSNTLFRRSNKEKLIFRDVLAHQARLTPYINYYPMTMENGAYLKKYYSSEPSEDYSLPIGEHLYLNSKFKKAIYKSIRKSPLLDKKEYKYSGLSFMIYPQMLSELFGRDYQEHLYTEFYKPLGASSLTYNPLGRIDMDLILPTELDKHYRYKLSHGRVHDEAAAVMGGVSGNAGLFASADDLAKMMQMYLQEGSYGGIQYLRPEVMNEFIQVQFPENSNRRGLAFDKPLFGNDTLSIEQSYPAPGVSPESYGHSGYTGTFVWIDPRHQLLYIFLSNRVYPTRENPLIYRKNIRPSIQQVFYDALAQRQN